jgi:hypothetical protein
VTITGTDLLGATDVEFGSTLARGIHVDSSTQITATAPAGTVRKASRPSLAVALAGGSWAATTV